VTLSLFTVGGTDEAGPTDPNQFPVQVANRLLPSGWQIVADQLDGLATLSPVRWFPINYPAALYPMAPSVQAGREHLVAAIQSAPGPFVLCGYSQGAIVTDVVWSQDILAATGVIHQRLNDVAAIFNFGDPLRCFPAGTLVRRADGTQCPIEDIVVGDQVVTAEASIGRVIATTQKDADSLVKLHIDGHHHLHTTEEHQILTKRGYIAAKNLKPGELIALPKFMGENVTYINPNYHAGKPCNPVRSYVKLPERIDLTPEFGRVIGLFLAEGSTQVGHSGMTVWDFCDDEADTLAAEIVSFFRKLGLEPDIRTSAEKHGCRVLLCGIGWARMFRSLCGHLAHGKRLHADITDGPSDFLEAVLFGWLEDDGQARRGEHVGTTVSHSLALSMYDIAQATGYHPTISTHQRGSCRRVWEVTVGVRKQNTHDVTAYEDRWFTSRNTSGIVGVSYRATYPGTSKWRACYQRVELGQFSSKEEAAKAVRVYREELARRGKLTDERGRTRSAQHDTHVWRTFIELENVKHDAAVYDFTVEGNHSYVAEGIGVHNCPGIANGNLLAGIPLPTKLDGVVTGGIAGPADLTPQQTPDFLYSFALDGDLYACAPVGENPWENEAAPGRVETGIYDIVQQATFIDVVAIAEDLLVPVGTVEAIINGLTFAAAGANAPHYRYGPYVPVAAHKIRQLAAQTSTSSVIA
jgi:intein/homing endonuclease